MEWKFPKIPAVKAVAGRGLYEGTELEISEKLDGANFSFFVNESGGLTFRSRNTVLPADAGGSWSHAIKYLRGIHVENPFEVNYIYFGECMTKHTLNYGVTPAFIGYAVMDFINYLPNWKPFFENRGIPVVPTWSVSVDTPLMDLVNKLAHEPSSFGTTGVIREGVVVKNYDKQIFAKYVREEFKEENKKVFGESAMTPKMDETDKVLYRYCTTGRIHKMIQKIMDDGRYSSVEMRMMEHLPSLVADDILEENILEISYKYKGIDFKSMRKLTAHYCLQYLKAFLNWDYDDELETLHRRVGAQFSRVHVGTIV